MAEKNKNSNPIDPEIEAIKKAYLYLRSISTFFNGRSQEEACLEQKVSHSTYNRYITLSNFPSFTNGIFFLRRCFSDPNLINLIIDKKRPSLAEMEKRLGLQEGEGKDTSILVAPAPTGERMKWMIQNHAFLYFIAQAQANSMPEAIDELKSVQFLLLFNPNDRSICRLFPVDTAAEIKEIDRETLISLYNVPLYHLDNQQYQFYPLIPDTFYDICDIDLSAFISREDITSDTRKLILLTDLCPIPPRVTVLDNDNPSIQAAADDTTL